MTRLRVGYIWFLGAFNGLIRKAGMKSSLGDWYTSTYQLMIIAGTLNRYVIGQV